MDITSRLQHLQVQMASMNWNYNSIDESSEWRRWNQMLIEITRESGELRRLGFNAEVDEVWIQCGPKRR